MILPCIVRTYFLTIFSVSLELQQPSQPLAKAANKEIPVKEAKRGGA